MTTTNPTNTLVFPVTIKTDNSKPTLPTHRLSVTTWKTPKSKKNDPSFKLPVARATSVPRLSLICEPSSFAGIFLAAVEDMQDAMIRDYIEAEFAKGNTTDISIPETYISQDAISTYASEEATGKRLSKERVGKWFDSELEEHLTLAIINKFLADGKEPSETTVSAMVANTREATVKLSSPTASFSELVAKQLQRAIELAPAHPTKDQLLAKLTTILQPVAVTLEAYF